jgi:hypothetical protein
MLGNPRRLGSMFFREMLEAEQMGLRAPDGPYSIAPQAMRAPPPPRGCGWSL